MDGWLYDKVRENNELLRFLVEKLIEEESKDKKGKPKEEVK